MRQSRELSGSTIRWLAERLARKRVGSATLGVRQSLSQKPEAFPAGYELASLPSSGGPLPTKPYPYTWVIYLDGSGKINAVNCSTGAIDVGPSSEWGVFATALATIATALTPGATRRAFVRAGKYPGTTLADYKEALCLDGEDGFNGATVIDYATGNPTLAVAVTGAITDSHMEYLFGSNQTLCYDNVSDGGGSVGLTLVGSSPTQHVAKFNPAAPLSYLALSIYGWLEITGNSPNSQIYASHISNLILDSGAEHNTIVANIDGTVTDNSGKVNFMRNTGLSGVQSAPHAPQAAKTTNNLGTKVQVIITIGATATLVTKNATAVFQSTAAIPACVTVDLEEGESITLDQVTAVTWQWFAVS